MSVRVGSGELDTGCIHGLAGHLALPGFRVKGELKHVARSNGGVGQPDFSIEVHVELFTQTDGVKYNGVVIFQFGVSKVVDLQA